jgi:hypothetical protein
VKKIHELSFYHNVLMIYTLIYVLVTNLSSRWAVSAENSSHCRGFLGGFAGSGG